MGAMTDRLVAQRDAVLTDARKIVDSAAGDLTAEQLISIRAARTTADELDAQIKDVTEIESRSAAAAPVVVANAGGAKVKSEDRTYTARKMARGEALFFADAWQAQQGDFNARDRIARHLQEAKVEGEIRSGVESRAVTSSGFAGLVVPQYLVDLAALAARNGRPVANAVTRLELPDQGMSLIIPRGTTGASEASQATENSSVSSTDEVWANLTVPVVTVAGQQDVSRQSLERGIPGLDQLIFRDLAGAYAAELDRQVLAGSGASGQMLGLQNTAGINQQTAFVAAATATTFWSKLSGAINGVEASGTVVAPANLVIMHPRRWSWIMQQVDSQGRPLATPVTNGLQVFNGFGVDVAPGAYSGNPQTATTQVDFNGFTVKGYIQGLPVITDANTPTAVGTGPEDLVWVVNTAHCLLWENGDGMPNQLRFEQTLGNQLTVKLVAYNYAAFTAARYPTAVSQIGSNAAGGFGLIAPTF